jgi:hypothetical protein
VDETGPGSCPTEGFGITGVRHSGFITSQFWLIMLEKKHMKLMLRKTAIFYIVASRACFLGTWFLSVTFYALYITAFLLNQYELHVSA